MTIRALLAASMLAAVASPAAAIINSPVPTNAYITFGGFDWAWAGPCAAEAPSCGVFDLSYQATQGWRLPTLAEFAAGPAPIDFIFAAGNVPLNGASVEGTVFFNAPGNGACAAAYFFNAERNNCDYNDAVVGGIFGNGGPFTGNSNVETWVIRGNAVPEPASWAMLIAGFGLVGAVQRRRLAAVAT